jgi:hypothetical protein
MTVTVIIYRIDDTYDDGGWGATTYQADYFIHVLFDNVTKAISVQIRTAGTIDGGSLIASPTTGPNLFYGHNGTSVRIYPVDLNDIYDACDGTTREYINVLPNFPYGGYAFELDSSRCAITPVCDLEFSSLYTTTKASGPSTADGAFTVSASSTNGTIKYSLTPNFDYATETNTTGVFTGLYPGDYVVYAKDPLGCQDTLNVTVEITEVYGVRFRHEFNDNLNNFTHRIDIEERAYAGAVEEVNAGPSPIRVYYKGDPNDPSRTVIPGNAEITLLSEVAGQFQDIFLGDDRKYRVKYYINEGAGLNLFYTGYPVPEFYSEPYISEPFYVTITATDGLGELTNTDFLDANDNNYRGDLSGIKIISEILKKTPLGLSIRSCVDVFETTMDTADSDDPLAQAYVDARLFFTTANGAAKCQTVLDKLLAPFRARIFQSDGYWYIVRLEKSVASSIPYRQFDEDGVYESEDTIAPEVNLGKPEDTDAIIWRDKSQILSFIRNYGFFKITHNLGRDSNLIDEGAFELTDLVEDGNGDLFFKNWNFNIGQTGLSYGYEKVLGGTGAFFAKFNEITSEQANSVLYTRAIPFEAAGGGFIAQDRIKLKFKIAAQVYNVFPWVRVKWQLKVTDLDTDTYYSFYAPQNDISDFETDTDVLNDLYIEKFSGFQDFELGMFHFPVSITNGTIQLLFYFHNHWGRDFDDYADMRDVPTVNEAGKDKRLYFGDTSTIYYKLVRTIEAESEPTRIRPDDYNSLSNPQQWELQEDFALGPNTSIISKWLFDDVQIAFYPFISVDGNYSLIDPPETAVYQEEVSRFIKFDYEKEIYLGDAPEFNNSPNLYKGYFRLSDGTPTNKWRRSGLTTEELYLLEILLNDVKGQMSEPVRKFNGQAIADRVVHYINFLTDYLDSKRYTHTNFEFDAKEFTYTLDLVEVKAGVDGEPPTELGGFKATAFSSGFKIGS